MKLAGVLFFITLLVTACDLQKEIKNDWKELKLKAKVKSVRESSYEIIEKNGKLDTGNAFLSRTIVFNSDGYITDIVHYNADGSTNSNTKINYTSNNLKTEEVLYSPHLVGKVKYKYDSKGHKIGMQSFNSDDQRVYYETYRLNDEGNVTEKISYKVPSRIVSKEVYKYDGKGKKIELREYSSNLKLEGVESYKYDEKGNEIEAVYFNSYSGIQYKRSYVYDKEGNKIEVGSNMDHQYEYDKVGNWTKYERIKDGKPKLISLRELVYF